MATPTTTAHDSKETDSMLRVIVFISEFLQTFPKKYGIFCGPSSAAGPGPYFERPPGVDII